MRWAARRARPGDAVIVVARRHWSGVAGPIAVAVAAIACAAGAAAASAPRPVALAIAGALALTLLWLVASYLRWRRAPAALCTGTLLVRRGVRRPDVIDLGAVRDVHVRQRRLQRLVRAGDVVIEDVDGAVTELPGMADPSGLRRELWRQVDQRRRQRDERVDRTTVLRR